MARRGKKSGRDALVAFLGRMCGVGSLRIHPLKIFGAQEMHRGSSTLLLRLRTDSASFVESRWFLAMRDESCDNVVIFSCLRFRISIFIKYSGRFVSAKFGHQEPRICDFFWLWRNCKKPIFRIEDRTQKQIVRRDLADTPKPAAHPYLQWCPEGYGAHFGRARTTWKRLCR